MGYVELDKMSWMEGKECPHCKSIDTEIVLEEYNGQLWECFSCKKTFAVYTDQDDKPQKEE